MSRRPFDAASGGRLIPDGDRKPDHEAAPLVRGSMESRAGFLTATVCALPWLLALGVVTAVLLQTGTPVVDIARYGAYWCFAVTLPGLLLVRATVGTRGNWPEDIALGAVAGLALELVCFALWSVLGLEQLLWLWPVPVLVVFAAVPGLRRHWRISSPRPLPRLWSWGVASAIAVCAVLIRPGALAAPLPPAGGYYNPDVAWHLAITHELTRSFPPQIPQVSGEILRYHWFANVHMAAAHLVSGAPVATVVLRLWIIPLLALTALIGARLVMELSGRWWSGPVAAWSLIVFTGVHLLPVTGDSAIIFPTSPSQVFLLPLFMGAAILVVRALRGLRLGVGWAVLALLLVACAGAKPTAMPLVLAGTCLAGVTLLVRRRRQWLAALSVVAMAAVILPVSLIAVSGGQSLAKIGYFDFVEWIPLYHSLTGLAATPAAGPSLPEGVNDLSTRSRVILGILLLVPLVANIGHLAPFAWLGSRRLRKDPAAWFMAGVVIAGLVVYVVLSHLYYSQAWFLRLAIPVASVFGAWALAAAVPSGARSGRQIATVLAGGAFIGAGVVVLGRMLTPDLTDLGHNLRAVMSSFAVPLAVAGAATVVGILTWLLVRRRVPGLRGWGSALALSALVLGGPAMSMIYVGPDPVLVSRPLTDLVVRPSPYLVARRVAAPAPVPGTISPGAGAAFAWVDQHTPNDAVVATNRHCASGPERPWCLSLAFWVSGLGGRRTVLEGWGYTYLVKTPNYPTPFPARLAVNDAVFTHPSLSSIDRLRQLYGASWLVADTSAGPVSSKLARFAAPRFASGEVTVYQLR